MKALLKLLGHIPGRVVLPLAALIAFIILVSVNVGFNEAGYRQVIQSGISGELSCKFKSGWYFTEFGKSTEYKDIITYDFDREANAGGSTINANGLPVRYSDGGLGTVLGIAQFSLPSDCESMLNIHKKLRSNRGVAFKVIKPFVEEIADKTAGLMTSGESYAEKRSTYTDWFKDQLKNGRYQTKMIEVTVVEDGKEHCLDETSNSSEQQKDCANVKKTRSNVSVVDYDAPALYQESILKIYGIEYAGAQLASPDYEPKTLKQIADKREAEMQEITARANAEKAKAQAIEEEQKGKMRVIQAKYNEEQAAAKEIVQAEKRVKLAEQMKLEAAQKALAAEEYKKEQILIGQGDAERKRLVLEADGALEQKLAAYVQVHEKYAAEFGKQKWVPDIQFASNGEASGNSATTLIDLLTAKTTKDLALELDIKN